MARRKARTLTELELEIMHVVWQKGEATVPELQEAFDSAGRPLALPSIRTMLSILQEKGYVTRRHEGRGFVYCPAVGRNEAEKRILRDVVERAFRGSASSLVAALVSGEMVSGKELGRIKRLIAKHEKGGEK